MIVAGDKSKTYRTREEEQQAMILPQIYADKRR